ncbi:DUF371 domain-containing protein [Candidatus Woesearchaeota archaeon]|nr:DUF371 domain-containing protein [Candidatus Woesearchaeota archaeon]
MVKMQYSFNCYGHENITARHRTTLEFTRDAEVSLKGDCIIGVKADFSFPELKKFIENGINANKKNQLKNIPPDKKTINKKNKINEIPVKIIIKSNNHKEEINGFLNPDFDDENEIVIRKTDFASGRTFAVKSDKAAFDLSNELVNLLKNPENKIEVIID